MTYITRELNCYAATSLTVGYLIFKINFVYRDCSVIFILSLFYIFVDIIFMALMMYFPDFFSYSNIEIVYAAKNCLPDTQNTQ